MAPPVLEVTDLACRRGGRRVFDHVSFSLGAGELLSLTGPNGSGKTTVLRALALLVPAEAGAIRWQGTDVDDDRDQWRGRLAWLGHLDGLKGDFTVEENVRTAERLRTGVPEPARVAAMLQAFGLMELGNRPVRTLSAGQRRRAALARVAASSAPVWLLDEPLNALDARSQAAFHDVLAGHLAAGGLAVAATHAPLAGARIFKLAA